MRRNSQSNTNLFETKAKDLQSLRDSVTDAINVAGNLWFSYIFTLFYLAVAVGGVTHIDLLFENPVKLPFLNVDLPLVSFFALAPAIFFIVHTYILVYFVLLSNKIRAFDIELRLQITDQVKVAQLRRQLPTNIFIQLLAGPPESRIGSMGLILWLIAQTSLVFAPLGLFVLFQLQFLPFHSESVIWIQRVFVVMDVLLLWILWPMIWLAKDENSRLFYFKNKTILLLHIECIIALLFSFNIATFPGEWLEDAMPRLDFIPWRDSVDTPWRLTSMHDLLVVGSIDLRTDNPRSIWSNRLVLPNLDIIDHTKFDTDAKIRDAKFTYSLRGRHLEGAIFIKADLRKVDFSASILKGARLDSADLRGANFLCAETKLDPKSAPESIGPHETKDDTKGCAHLEGATLRLSRLAHTNFQHAYLQGASLIGASFQGATLISTNFQGADLSNSDINAADLLYADFRGASLEKADLNGSLLNSTQLQGANLSKATLIASKLDEVLVWHTYIESLDTQNTIISNPEFKQKELCKIDKKTVCDFTVESFNELIRHLRTEIPEGANREQALMRASKMLDPNNINELKDKQQDSWKVLIDSSPSEKAYNNAVITKWKQTACLVEDAPYPLLGVADRLFFEHYSNDRATNLAAVKLIKALLNKESCSAAHGLTDNERASLQQISQELSE